MLRKWEYWVGLLAVLVTFGLALLVVLNWHSVGQITGYGYFGGFVVSALGGGTVLIPIPMAAVQFTLGGIILPWFGPAFLGPLFVGLVCSFGESIGSLSIYAAGYSSATPLFNTTPGGRAEWLQKLYARLMSLMERRGPWVMFGLSAVMNPFFFPASLASGAVRFGVKKYFLIVFAGKFIKCSAIAYAGYFGLRSLFGALGIHV
ncbi:MAG: VTT domain-containing protein [Dehalococcoidales bacterium]|jgi:membrane protein DedA with SNARE-associated domain